MTKVNGGAKLVRDTFQLTERQREKLRELSKKTGESKSHFVREALNKYFKSKESGDNNGQNN
jgi:predicted DNA-binding protein